MKHPAGYAKPRRLAAPRRRVRLDLKRRPNPAPDDELDIHQKRNFWKWVGLVALLHLVLIGFIFWVYETASPPKPPEQFISLLPEGAVVKGAPGTQEAHKVGPTTSAPAVHHASSPPAPPVEAKPVPAKPVVKTEVAPPKPATPKVKVDLTLVTAPTPVTDKPAGKPKPHHPKPVIKKANDTEEEEAAASPESAGLSKEQIAEKLGEKLDASGVKNATQTGTSGSANAHPNSFADFTDSIRDQVMNLWKSPELMEEPAVYPVVQIHIEKDGRVPPEFVHLIESSGNSAYDDSAVVAAKSLGYLHEPLPDGCPPDIPITFKLTR